MNTETEDPKMYRLVCFHDTERKSEIQHIGSGVYPRDWNSISRGYDTVEELRKGEGMPEEPCSVCGSPFSTNYFDDVKQELLRRHMCFHCNFWQDLAERNHERHVRVDGKHYTIGDKNAGKSEFRGFGGRAFKIRFFDERGEVETTNLWHQGDIPIHFQKVMPNNAEFVKP